MKNLFFMAIVACLGFIACDTPSPATTNPEDSTGIQTQPDTSRVDTTTQQRDTTQKRDTTQNR